MSAAVLWEFYCDECEGTESSVTITGARSLSAAWREAKTYGWSEWLNGMKGHFCPAHRRPRMLHSESDSLREVAESPTVTLGPADSSVRES